MYIHILSIVKNTIIVIFLLPFHIVFWQSFWPFLTCWSLLENQFPYWNSKSQHALPSKKGWSWNIPRNVHCKRVNLETYLEMFTCKCTIWIRNYPLLLVHGVLGWLSQRSRVHFCKSTASMFQVNWWKGQWLSLLQH